MEFSVLKIELLFTLIQQFNLSLHIEQRKFQISPPPGEQDHSNAPPQVQHTIKSPAHPITCLTFCHFFQLNCMADQDSWYDLDWKTTDGINFILTNKGILLQYQSKMVFLYSLSSLLCDVLYNASRMKDFAFVSPQKYPGDLLAGKVMRDFGPQLVCWR